ncbi:MAG: protein kinase [Verrucomicrobiota bacterium]
MSTPLEHHNIGPGTHLGHYIITEKIAQGGMGTVYKALEPALERYVAIKVLRADFAEDRAYIASFEEEARAVAALRHPNIVPIYFIGVERSVAYFAMAYIEGENLDNWIDAKRRMTTQEGLWFMTQAVAALQCAGQSGIVHLDIKPANFLLDSNSTIMLTDFGLARRTSQEMTEEEKRDAFGTPAYVSPEQITREPTDQRTDIYSLGATLYHLLVGHAPFEGETIEDIIWGHLEKPFPEQRAQVAGVPMGWTYLIKKMMERNPADRFQTYEELLEALGQVDSFIYETVRIEAPEAQPIVLPRSGEAPETLYGILRKSAATWRADTQKTDQTDMSRAKVLDSLKDQSVQVGTMTSTLLDLTVPSDGETDDMLDAFQKLPGLLDATRALANFMEPPKSEKTHEPSDILEILSLRRARQFALVYFALNFECKPFRQFNWKPLWNHLFTTGCIMDFMYDALDLKRSGLEFATGFMHGLGKLILAELYPYTYFHCLDSCIKHQRPLAEVEKDLMGITSGELLSIWCAQQGFPSAMCDVFTGFETPEEIKKKSVLSHALVSAIHLSKLHGIGYSGDLCLDPRPWDELPSTTYIWELRRNREYTYEDFTQGFLEQFRQFPDLYLI